MRDLIVHWLTDVTPFWHSALSIDQFVTGLQETFKWFFLIAFWLYLGNDSGQNLVVTAQVASTKPSDLLFSQPNCKCPAFFTIYHFIDCSDSINQITGGNIDLGHGLQLCL